MGFLISRLILEAGMLSSFKNYSRRLGEITIFIFLCIFGQFGAILADFGGFQVGGFLANFLPIFVIFLVLRGR